MACIIDRYLIINDHFKRDLRRFGCNNGGGGAPGFYQRAASSAIHKSYNEYKYDESKNENDHYKARTVTPSSGIYESSVRKTITKRSNYMPRVHSFESDQWHPNTTTRPFVTKTNNPFHYAETNKILKSYNKVQPIGHENDQWHPSLSDSEQQKYYENMNIYHKNHNATITKSYNQVQPINYESDQWHPRNTYGTNIRYQNFENNKQTKPWHVIAVQQEEENKLANRKMDDLLQRTVLSLENIEIQMLNTSGNSGVGQGKEWLQNVPRERKLNNHLENTSCGKTKKYVIKGKQTSHVTNNNESENRRFMESH